ncbi:MAG: rRNA maturation RNase YbeY [Candidatus Margulisbacteria bacterium]|jgi:probable rRNA maturation factor|nr:rRNA maturation RNase YbeY [Candidatus Margulisiibacteriota bacterium]
MLCLNYQSVTDRPKLSGLRRIVLSLLKKIKFRDDLSITFCTRRQMQALNKKFRGLNQPTDVLSFAGGDIVIAPALAAQNARKYRNAFRAEIIYLIIHALCHLRGYDHAGRADTARMRAAENRLLAYIRKKYNIQLTGRINEIP